ncbi:UDP-glucose--hexose-1-phosphate uridylyltransferase [Hydromonas duriensis]|uniref:Galactose-1-phosphate uridylyltransferase n=1 Tax=Hydromonas duriensis TaxID=1527608 RepID=A0A4R6YAZ5_9BURK|nr:UDP-glucose--hexose-1-phosphate uridylyltransferase [Hydromonas duriensis]TDR32736.1 UTP-hexose-1-phosphate uridylyltransferase [Hydromonas duriensis]
MVCDDIARLVNYGVAQNLCQPSDVFYVRHRLMSLLKIDTWVESMASVDTPAFGQIQQVLDRLLTYAVEHQVLPNDGITQKDLFDTALMDCLLPPPSVVQARFASNYQQSPVQATSEFYQHSRASNYVRVARVAKNLRWTYPSEFGDLDITINLSKPEKDPKAIVAEGAKASENYPQCVLCRENEGYAGRVNHPARHNLRLMPLSLNDEPWFLQYSPYEYYNEHCIVLKATHEPMTISELTFERLLSFVSQYPHYFMGSNADLPIVGGSILSHDHFQGGRHTFAMANARVIHSQISSQYSDLTVQILHWPLSVVRLSSANQEGIKTVASQLLHHWRNYSDESVDIHAFTGDTPHNTITPIARQRDGVFELDLVLRNNRTSVEHPLGIFHPHRELHHIKKENIGLIEVMGLAVLPDRLATALNVMQTCLENQQDLNAYPELSAHAEWFEHIRQGYQPNTSAQVFLRTEVGRVFEQVLMHAGVFKTTPTGVTAFKRFLGNEF